MDSFYEILDYCGFDLEKADAMANKYYIKAPWMKDAIKEALEEIGLEKIQSESARPECR